MRANVVVKVSPSRLEAALYRGSRIADRRCQRLDASTGTRGWPATLSGLHTPLARMIAEMNAAGEHATIIYAASPSGITNVSDCHISTGEENATHAAELGLASLCPFSLDDNVFGTQLLYTDPHANRSTTATEPGEPTAMLHLASSADTLDTSNALADLARQAGLIVAQIIPAEALVLRAAVEKAVENARNTGGSTAVLWMADHGCALAVATDDDTPGQRGSRTPRLAFVRPIGVGLEAFVDALTKPLRVRHNHALVGSNEASGETTTLDRHAARRVLRAVGVPTPDADIPEQPLLTGASLLPALNPVMQRLSVEVKQSIRFGLPDAQRGKLKLIIAGNGALVPNLGAMIARHSGVMSAALPVPQTPIPPEPIGPDTDQPDTSDGFIDAVQPYLDLSVNLAPPEVMRGAAIVRVKQAMWIGVAAALAMIGFDAYSTRVDLRREREQLVSLQGEIAAAESSTRMNTRAIAAVAEFGRVRGRITASMPPSPDWAALLASISMLTPAEARLTDITASMPPASRSGANTSTDVMAANIGNGARCRILGYMPTDMSTSVTRRIDDYLAALNNSPIITGTQLGPTRLVQTQLGPSRSFDITLMPIALPATPPGDDSRVTGVSR